MTGQERGERTPSKGLKSSVAALVRRVKGLRIARSVLRYSETKGSMLAGGIAYSTIFSLAAALTIAWSVFMATLGRDDELRGKVIEAVNQALPGLLKETPGDAAGIINPNSLILDSAVNPATIIAAVVLVWTATSLMTNIRRAVQAQFGIVVPEENFVVQKLRDLLGFVLLALGVVAVTVVSTAAVTLGGGVLEFFGVSGALLGWLLRVLGLAVAVAVSALTFVQLFRVTAAVSVPRKDLWGGALLGGVVIIVVLSLGTQLVSSVAGNPLLAASTSLATLLLWVNLLARVLLLVAAFTANPTASSESAAPAAD